MGKPRIKDLVKLTASPQPSGSTWGLEARASPAAWLCPAQSLDHGEASCRLSPPAAVARPREFTWSLNRPPSQREGALSFAHLVTVPIILTNECYCCSRFTGETTGSAKIRLKSHSLWDLPAAGLYFSVSEMGLTRMPCSEPRSRHPQGLGHASSSSVSSSHRQRKAGGSRGFKFPPSLFSVILPGSSALAAWIVGCGAWGGELPVAAKTLLVAFRDPARLQVLLAPERSLWGKPGETRSCRSAAPGSEQCCAGLFPVASASSGQRCPPRSRQPPGERRRRQEVRGLQLAGSRARGCVPRVSGERLCGEGGGTG